MRNRSLNKVSRVRVPQRFTAPRVGFIAALVITMLFSAGCAERSSTLWQGYLEAEFIYVGAPLAGQLETLNVSKGMRVEAGHLLFVLERGIELAAQQQAAAQQDAVKARLEDLRKGARPSEIAALEAQIEQARVSAEMSEIEFHRIQTLRETNVVAESEYDRTRLAFEHAKRVLDQLTAQLATARLGSRADMITAAEAEVLSAAAARERADWNVAQKSQTAPRAALVYDTLYRPGEYVQAGHPVVSLLAPELMKVRFFVPEAEVAGLKAGETVQVALSGQPPLTATISYVSPQPEYTPPVLYNRENRAKLVFMIEATFAPAVAQDLHPGQPVDVTR